MSLKVAIYQGSVKDDFALKMIEGRLRVWIVGI